MFNIINNEAVIIIDAKKIRNLVVLESHVAGFDSEDGITDIIGECHVRMNLKAEGITLEVEHSKRDANTDELTAYGWDTEGNKINPATNSTAKAFIKHLEKLQG